MIVTERDQRTLFELNGHGAMTIGHIARLWGVDISTAARRGRDWIEAGLVKKVRVEGVTFRLLVCTEAGCRACGDDLPPLRGIRRGTIFHDLEVIDLARKLIKKFGGSFEPARRIQHRRSLQDKTTHCPDGFLYVPNRTPVAVELELTPKSPRRLKKILEYYAARFDLGLVLYLTNDPAVKRLLQRVVHEVPSATPIQIEWFRRRPSEH